VADLARNDFAVLAYLVRVVRRQSQHLGGGADRRQRVAQLVRQHGQEFVLAVVGRLQRFFVSLASWMSVSVPSHLTISPAALRSGSARASSC
jgi:hypothetical protein